jgi:hypothetical protein
MRKLCPLFAAKAITISAYSAEIKRVNLRSRAGVRVVASMEFSNRSRFIVVFSLVWMVGKHEGPADIGQTFACEKTEGST